jgi:hypothetical protein
MNSEKEARTIIFQDLLLFCLKLLTVEIATVKKINGTR